MSERIDVCGCSKKGLESTAGRLYRIQLQHQLMVCDAKHGWLVFYDRTNTELVEFEVVRDEALIAEIRSKGREFFDRFVAKRKEPAKDPTRDVYMPKGEVEIARWNQCAADYAAAQEATDALQKQIEAYAAIKNRCRDELTEMMGEFLHADFAGIALTKRMTRGTVNYRDFAQQRHPGERAGGFSRKEFGELACAVNAQFASEGFPRRRT